MYGHYYKQNFTYDICNLHSINRFLLIIVTEGYMSVAYKQYYVIFHVLK